MVDELPDHVISRSGTPNQWAFDDKEPSLKTAPPRPTSATCCTPPVPRKVKKTSFYVKPTCSIYKENQLIIILFYILDTKYFDKKF